MQNYFSQRSCLFVFNFKKEFMQCPLCGSEIGSNAVVCEKCGAIQVIVRTPAGVVVGWVGMVMSILWLMLGTPLLILPIMSISVKGYPWPAFVICAIIAAGLLWYSKSTIHSTWILRKD
jgi:hypothetical protein